jgi:hypothetical protein
MRSHHRFAGVWLAFLANFAGAPEAWAADTTSATVVVTAQFGSRTSLRVSSELLQFDVMSPGQPATVSVDFAAGARTRSGAEVILSVERLRAIEGPGGAADVESSVRFEGEGAGTLGGDLSVAGPSLAGKWLGSGMRAGRIVFSLRAAASGSYVLPVRFVLSAP